MDHKLKEKVVCELADLYKLRKTVEFHKDSKNPELMLMVKNFHDQLKPIRISVLEMKLGIK
jgi:hypothetical protein